MTMTTEFTGIRTLAEVSTQAEAERLVDHLSEAGFAVERVRIVALRYAVQVEAAHADDARHILGLP